MASRLWAYEVPTSPRGSEEVEIERGGVIVIASGLI